MIKNISLCLIVKNEEKGIERFLEQVYPFVDEILLGDTGSTDNTVLLASEFSKVNVLHINWEDDFAKARNQVLEQASGKWILVLDVDEFLSLSDLSRLKKIANTYVSKACLFTIRHYINDTFRPGFIFTEKDNALSGGALGYIETTKIAFFENDKRIRYNGLIHEAVQDSLKAIGEVPVKEDIVMHHYGYLNSSNDEATNEAKYKYYLQLGKQQIDKTPDQAKPYFDVSLIYLNQGDYQNSLKFLQQAIDIDADYFDALYNKGVVCFLLGNFQQSYDVFMYLKDNTSFNRQTIFDSLGRVSMKLHKYAEAVECFNQAILLDNRNMYAFYNLGVIYQAQKNYKDAYSCFSAVLRLNQNFSLARLGVGICALGIGSVDEALELFLQIDSKDSVYPDALYHIGFIYQQQKKYNEAINCYAEVLQNGSTVNALYNIALCYESLGNKVEAVNYYKNLLELNPSLEKDISPKIEILSS